jgi:peptide/nickel transport system substrate-binding protein
LGIHEAQTGTDRIPYQTSFAMGAVENMKNKVLFSLIILVTVALLGATVSFAQDFHESPMLTAQVDAGTLPALAERLPVSPAVITPFNEVGQYGGNMRVGFTGTNPGWGGLWYIAGWENLAAWNADFSGVVPNIAESWEVSEDVREYTFHLREGMKWSDGEPFTADDIMFYIEDILFNEELSPSGPIADWLPADGRDEFVAEKIDDYTVKFTFANPYGTFLYTLAQWNGRHITFFPKHYLTQFHADYNENVADLVAEAEGVEDWVGLFNQKANGPTEDTNSYWNNLDRPLLFPWIPTSVLGANTQMSMVRNPYYWKVDTEGNQLPYVDEITGISYQDSEARTLAMINGDLDYIKDPAGDDRIIFFDAVDSGAPLKISSPQSDAGTTQTVHFNRNTPDTVLGEIFANKDFRIGMSHAINRQEIIDIVFFGQGTPSQAAPLESSPLYNEQLATQYTEYNVDLANESLDKVVPDKDADGYRLRPDGQPLAFVFTVSNDLSWGGNYVQVTELLIGYWDAVGVRVTLNSVADAQATELRENNEIQAFMFTGEGGAGLTAILDPRYYVPGELFGLYGNGWWASRVGSQEAVQVEMPQEILDMRAQYEEVLTQPTQEGQIEKMKEVLQNAADQFWVLGIARPGPGYQPYHERIGNQPETWIAGWIEGVQKITLPEQWYIIQ